MSSTRRDVASFAASCGYEGLELACWGDHFDVHATASELEDKRSQLVGHELECWAISNHLVGQAVCDEIDERHKSILPESVWGDGDPEGVRQRAAEEMKQEADIQYVRPEIPRGPEIANPDKIAKLQKNRSVRQKTEAGKEGPGRGQKPGQEGLEGDRSLDRRDR